MEIYVHPSVGDDSLRGTQMYPYRTLSKAISEVTDIINSVDTNEEYNINIMLGCGVNKIDSTVVLENIKPGIKLRFRSWDDMYTTLSCAVRINGFDFEYDKSGGIYSYKSNAVSDRLYVNGRLVEAAQNPDAIMPGESYADGDVICYCPREGEDVRYSQTESAGKHTMFDIRGCSDIVFENIDFTGIGDGEMSHILLDNCSSVRIENCRFKNNASLSVKCIGDSRDVVVCDCEFSDNSAPCIGVYGKSDVKLSNNYFDSCSGTCVCVGDYGHIEVSDSTFSNTLLPVCCASGMGKFEFENNVITNFNGGRIVLDNQSAFDNPVVKNNYLLTGNRDLIFVKSSSESRNKTCGQEYGFTYSNVTVNKFKEAGYRKKIRNYGDII